MAEQGLQQAARLAARPTICVRPPGYHLTHLEEPSADANSRLTPLSTIPDTSPAPFSEPNASGSNCTKKAKRPARQTSPDHPAATRFVNGIAAPPPMRMSASADSKDHPDTRLHPEPEQRDSAGGRPLPRQAAGALVK